MTTTPSITEPDSTGDVKQPGPGPEDFLWRDYELRGLDTVVIPKDDLTAKIQENYDRHREIFEDAIAGYQVTVVRLLQEHIYRISTNAPERVLVNLPFPEDHSDDYERVLTMLNMSVDTHLELSQHDFAQYVMDDWGWKAGWTETTAMYSSHS
jgi:hypothetical protein